MNEHGGQDIAKGNRFDLWVPRCVKPTNTDPQRPRWAIVLFSWLMNAFTALLLSPILHPSHLSYA
jgi:hypothetical protein